MLTCSSRYVEPAVGGGGCAKSSSRMFCRHLRVSLSTAPQVCAAVKRGYQKGALGAEYSGIPAAVSGVITATPLRKRSYSVVCPCRPRSMLCFPPKNCRASSRVLSTATCGAVSAVLAPRFVHLRGVGEAPKHHDSLTGGRATCNCDSRGLYDSRGLCDRRRLYGRDNRPQCSFIRRVLEIVVVARTTQPAPKLFDSAFTATVPTNAFQRPRHCVVDGP